MSAGMLAQCVRNMKKWRREADLFLGNAEALPFRDESFDAVLHVGGINFFAEKRKAVEEMVRVAKPGAKIVIACETEKAIKSNRIGIRLVFGKRLMEKMVEFRHKDMRTLIPENMSGIRFEQIWEGNGYLLEFRKPSGT
jgi:ubiquinone/menaquinone biosynthesis C-methylase UbiE